MTQNRFVYKIKNTILHSSTVHLNNTNHVAKGDSVVTKHYIAPTDVPCLSNTFTTNGPSVFLSNGETVSATAKGFLPLSTQLSSQAQQANVLPGVRTSLISLGQLADDNCDIILTKHHLKVFKNCQCILSGASNFSNGLWDIPINNPPPFCTQKFNVIIPKNQNITNLLQYLYASLFSPTKSTLLQAIKNGIFAIWPGLTYANVQKYLQNMPATALGHLDQCRQGPQSTKICTDSLELDTSPQRIL